MSANDTDELNAFDLHAMRESIDALRTGCSMDDAFARATIGALDRAWCLLRRQHTGRQVLVDSFARAALTGYLVNCVKPMTSESAAVVSRAMYDLAEAMADERLRRIAGALDKDGGGA